MVNKRISLVVIFATCFFHLVLRKMKFPTFNSESGMADLNSYRLSQDYKPIKVGGPNIFYIHDDGIENSAYKANNLQGRFLCALESASKLNPSSKIYLILNKDSKLKDFPEYFNTNLKNLQVLRLNFDELFDGTSLEHFWHNVMQRVCPELYPYNRVNLYRAKLVHAFGGLYSDLDCLPLKAFPIQGQPTNFLQAEAPRRVTNAFFKFHPKHPFIAKTLERFEVEYKCKGAYNGPFLMSRVATNFYCEVPIKDSKYPSWACPNITIYPEQNFAPVGLYDTNKLLDPNFNLQAELDQSMVMHTWNRQMNLMQQKTEISKESPFYKLMRAICPLTEQFVLQHETYL